MRESAIGKLFEQLDQASAFKRVAFLKPETPQDEVEEQFAELLFRWTTLKVLDKEVQDQALDLAELSEEPITISLRCSSSRWPMRACAMPRTMPATATAPSASRRRSRGSRARRSELSGAAAPTAARQQR